MASSFSLQSGSYDGRYLKLTCTQTKDIEKNKSVISWKLEALGGNDNYYSVGPTKVYINGVEVYSIARKSWDSKVFPAAKGSVSGTTEISHNNDGKKSISVSFSTAIYVNAVSTYSGTWALDAIPRQATITYAPNFNDEQSPTINYSNPAGNAVTSLQACIEAPDGSVAYASYRDISKTGTSYRFDLTDAERNALTKAAANSNTLTVRFYIKTVIGNNTFYSYLTKTMSVVYANPTLYPIIEDTNDYVVSLTGKASKLVKYFSSPAVATGATAHKNATIKSHGIVNGNKSTTNASDTFYNVDNPLFAFWARDSRKNEVYQEINKINEDNWIDYVKITCNASPTNPTTDGKMTLNISGNYWNGNFGAVANYLTLQYRMTIAGQPFGEWITVPAELEGNTYHASVDFEGLDYQTTYAFEVRALDKLETTPVNYLEVQTTPVFDWGKNDFTFNVDAKGWFNSTVKNLPNGSGDREYWETLKSGVYWYDYNNCNVPNMPSGWGFVHKLGFEGDIASDFNILYFTQSQGLIYRRSGNLHNDSGWKPLANNYSTNEEIVGTWIDDKFVYRKVVKYTAPSTIGATGTTTNISIPHGVDKFNGLINCTARRGNNPLPSIGGWAATDRATYVSEVNSTNINLRIINDTWSVGSEFTFIIEYTKTTD